MAIFNHNEPVAYLVPAETYKFLMDMLDDCELSKFIESRGVDLVEVSIARL